MVAWLRAFPTDFRVEMGKPEMLRIYKNSVLADFTNEESQMFLQANLLIKELDNELKN